MALTGATAAITQGAIDARNNNLSQMSQAPMVTCHCN